MRTLSTFLIGTVLVAGCGPKSIALPADPIDRAATCGVAAAAAARKGAGLEAKLTLPQQGAILHYALLAGAEGERFDRDRVAAVVARMPEVEGRVTGGKWADLIPACAAAYPSTVASGTITLPADALEAQQGCDALADFMTVALRQQETSYVEEFRKYDELARTLDTKMGRMLAARGIDQEAGQAARSQALGALAKLGPPTAVMNACLKRFG